MKGGERGWNGSEGGERVVDVRVCQKRGQKHEGMKGKQGSWKERGRQLKTLALALSSGGYGRKNSTRRL